jgi:octopine/nopaline transport system substrate-binding protein
MMRLVAHAVLGIATTLALSVQAKEWKFVTIATEGAYEPWNLTLPGGKLGGFEPELMDNLCERIKIECKLTAQDWPVSEFSIRNSRRRPAVQFARTK